MELDLFFITPYTLLEKLFIISWSVSMGFCGHSFNRAFMKSAIAGQEGVAHNRRGS